MSAYTRLEVHRVDGVVDNYEYVEVEVRDGVLHVLKQGAYDLRDVLATYSLSSVIKWAKVA